MASVLVRRPESEQELAGLKALRLEVFVHEQGVPRELELDALDETAIHAVAKDGDDVVGTGRLLVDTPGQARIGRMAVRRSLRRRGLGGEVLRFLEAEAKDLGVTQLVLHAQAYVRGFYETHGYREEGEPFLEAGIEHVLMRKALA